MLFDELDNLFAIFIENVPGCWQFGWSVFSLQEKYWVRFKQIFRQKSVVTQWPVGVQSELLLKPCTVFRDSS